jgi:ribonuclease P protein component
MQRRYRLTRSQDFDAVYRKGRSISTRHLVLYWFPRGEEEDGEPRLGLAVPRSAGGAVQRNRIKRRLRDLWASRAEGVAAGCDYVLVVRPGLIEAAEAQGSTWLGERLDELLAEAGAA